MEDEKRAHLEELADQLESHDTAEVPRAQELKAEVRTAIESGDHESLKDRLMEDAIAFENDHPDLSAVIVRAAQLLGAAGL